MEARMFEGLRLVHWKTDLRNDGVLVLSLDRADEKVNALARPVIDELSAMLERIALELPKGVIVRSGKPGGIPGADIKSFESIETKGQTEDWIRLGQLVFQRLAELRCPTVAFFHGMSLGGGT
jgi:3-hydroxyacyl-CoA dehydrogenase/enoyl-CoA hydratase/3-hydroxybutyryl-CoA epimerase